MVKENKEIVEEKHEQVRPFYMERETDESGVSGTGVVACGAELPSGKCILEWRTIHSSVCVYNNIGDVAKIHGHKGKTKVIWGYPDEAIKEVKRKPRKKKTKKKVTNK